MDKKYAFLGTIWVLIIIAALITHSFFPAYLKEKTSSYEPYEYSQMYLENEPYSEIIIEYDYLKGQEPDETAITKLEEKIEKYTDKETIKSIVDDQISIAESEPSYDSNDISRLKKEYQNHERDGNQIAIYVLYVDGIWEDDNDVLGLSQRPGQIIIFNSVISGIETTNALGSGEIESPVLVHEFGHLLSLVGLNYESYHEDDGYPNHCDESAGECVMAGAVEIKEEMMEPPPSDFCELCQEDMEQISELEDPFGLEDVISYSTIVGQYMIGIWASAVLIEKAGKGKDRRKIYEEDYRYDEKYQEEEKTSSEEKYKNY
ncbi:MAG: hypothetical protein V5A76_03150 [Candidatus Thermoplasmatota archaeon]